MDKVVIIGGGQMGGALLRGLSASQSYQLAFVEPNEQRSDQLINLCGARKFFSVASALSWANTVVLAVKPQLFSQIAFDIADAIAENHPKIGSIQTIVSMMAGLSLAELRTSLDLTEKELLERGVVLVRTMPNLPLMVGKGAVAIADNGVAPAILQKVVALFSTVGSAITVSEEQIDAVTGLSGSGPAWVFEFAQGLIAGGIKVGLAPAVARELALQTIEGSLQMMRLDNRSPAELTSQVTSPGGTTIHGLHALENGRFRGVVMEAIEAATRRAGELGEK